MKTFCYLSALALLVPGSICFAYGPNNGNMGNMRSQSVDAPVISQPLRERHRANRTECPWDQLDMKSRAQVWSKMTPRHRDYHWRLMTNEERSELRQYLSLEEQKALRERFVMQQMNEYDRPYVLYKRLSKKELKLLREQVKQAQRQQLLSGMLKTPAQLEYEDQFLSSMAKMNDQTHQMLIITIQDNGPELTGIDPTEAPKLPDLELEVESKSVEKTSEP